MDDVSAAMRPHLAAVWDDREPMVAQVASEVIARIPTYATTPTSEVWIGMLRILERIVAGDPFAPPGPEDLEAAIGTGIQGSRAGIVAEDLVAAVLLGARLVEDEVVTRALAGGVPAEVVLAASRRSRAWAEDVAVAAAHGLAGSEPTRAEDAAAVLLAGIRSGTTGDALAALVAGAGLDPGGEHWLVVVRGSRGLPADEVDATRLRFAHPGTAWVTREGVLAGIGPRPPGPLGELVVGLAGPAPLEGLARALIDADRAARAAAHLLGPGVHDLAGLGLLLAVHEDPVLLQRLQDRWIEPLRSEPKHDLVRTARSWQTDRQVEAVARDLSVHPNTVRNRLGRIDALLPGWRSAKAQAELWAVLVADAAG